MKPLPIDGLLPDVLAALRQGGALVLKAAPGTGKTTRVPPALLTADFLDPAGEILVLEPRRLAAKLSAERVAAERGLRVGEEIGYQFRFENRTSGATRLRYLTEGMLMRRLLGDPELRGARGDRGSRTATAVLLDEFHERHLHGDVALAALRRLQRTSRADLKIVVMSATLDQDAVAAYLGAPVLSIDQKLHDVRIDYLPAAPARHLEAEVAAAVGRMLAETPGDLLVFLPGMGEIRRAEAALAGLAASGRIWVAPLHGELSKEEQARAVAPGRSAGPRKVILSTNVAETSLTIEGVTGVIDSGLHRRASHSWWSGVPLLKTRPISRASAVQRAGRAGRTAPGVCLRLYTKGDYEGRAPFETPEIRRADLCPTLLELLRLGVGDPRTFDWFERPAPEALEAALTLLGQLGATAGGRLTEAGARMAEIPAHPRFARALLEAARRGCLEEAATLSARLAGEEGSSRAKDQMLGAVRALGMRSGPRAPHALEASMLAGFPDRVALRKPGQDPHAERVELLLAGGGSAWVTNSAAVAGHDYFVALEAREAQGLRDARAKTLLEEVLPIPGELLLDSESGLLRDVDGPEWSESRKRIVSVSRLSYGALTLSESTRDFEPEGRDAGHAADAGALLARAIIGWDPARVREASTHDLMVALPLRSERKAEVESLLARLSLLAAADAQFAAVPDFRQPGTLGARVLALLSRFPSARKLEDAADADWLEALGGPAPHELDAWCPTQMQLGPARKSRIKYSLIQAPWIESRLQDFFGVKKNPTILKGRQSLILHLLAPNQRALQVTQDLEGFWKRVYPELRPQLSRRYPRHAWPEDPEKIPPREP